MKLQIVSDLHLEFFKDSARSSKFLKSLTRERGDVLVVAGDLATGHGLRQSIEWLCAHWKHVVYVAGNHEYYSGSPDVIARIGELLTGIKESNFTWLNNNTVTLDGVLFAGTTLWFDEGWRAVRHRPGFAKVNDFSIADFEPWVYEENARARKFLADLPQTDSLRRSLVVTHHLPLQQSVHPAYAGSPTNAFFLCDIPDTVQRLKPRIWVHGHTHESCDYTFGATRVLCNPYGYHDYQTNPEFKSGLIVSI